LNPLIEEWSCDFVCCKVLRRAAEGARKYARGGMRGADAQLAA
jgi:hypothetical protein